MRLNPKFIQLFGDAFIPILGFFLWNWSLYFIIIFYFLDLLTKIVLLHIKAKKIIDFNSKTNIEFSKSDQLKSFKSGVISSLYFVFVIFIVQISMPFIYDDFNTMKELNHFFMYKDMGIEQGYVLIPLIAFMGYTQYKMDFLKQGLFARIRIQELWKPHIQAMLVLVSLCSIGFILVQFVRLPESFIVISIVLLSSSYQYYLIKKKA
jgi:hypothetical protein